MMNSNPERDAKELLRGKPVSKKKNTRWVPKVGENYFYIFFCPISGPRDNVTFRKYINQSFDLDAVRANNCFRTKREAKKAAKAIDKILKGIL